MNVCYQWINKSNSSSAMMKRTPMRRQFYQAEAVGRISSLRVGISVQITMFRPKLRR